MLLSLDSFAAPRSSLLTPFGAGDSIWGAWPYQGIGNSNTDHNEALT